MVKGQGVIHREAGMNRSNNEDDDMTKRNRWLGLAVAAAFLSAPTVSLAKHGADDLLPEDPKPEIEIEVPGVQLAKHGADDLLPEDPQPEIEVETPGVRMAKHGADDLLPEDPQPEIEVETPGIA